jgi:hypothetical protein
MTQINQPIETPRDFISKIGNDDVSKIENPALKKILEETVEKGEKKPDIIQAYDRMYHTHNRG